MKDSVINNKTRSIIYIVISIIIEQRVFLSIFCIELLFFIYKNIEVAAKMIFGLRKSARFRIQKIFAPKHAKGGNRLFPVRRTISLASTVNHWPKQAQRIWRQSMFRFILGRLRIVPLLRLISLLSGKEM